MRVVHLNMTSYGLPIDGRRDVLFNLVCGLVVWINDATKSRVTGDIPAFYDLVFPGWQEAPVLTPRAYTRNTRRVTCLGCLALVPAYEKIGDRR
jgi:hypothetical protein